MVGRIGQEVGLPVIMIDLPVSGAEGAIDPIFESQKNIFEKVPNSSFGG